jgi:hypothetical protein
LGGKVRTIEKNTEALAVGSKVTGLEVNADETEYIHGHVMSCHVMSRDQNAGRTHNIKIDNSSIERVEKFKYLGKTLSKYYSGRN